MRQIDEEWLVFLEILRLRWEMLSLKIQKIQTRHSQELYSLRLARARQEEKYIVRQQMKLELLKNSEGKASKKGLRYIPIKLILNNNEELVGFFGEQKYEWEKAGLTSKQIKRKEIMFIIEFCREKLVCWIGWDRIQVRIGIK